MFAVWICLLTIFACLTRSLQQQAFIVEVNFLVPTGIISFGTIYSMAAEDLKLKIYGDNKSASIDFADVSAINKTLLAVSVEDFTHLSQIKLKNFGLQLTFNRECSQAAIEGQNLDNLSSIVSTAASRQVEVVDDFVYFCGITDDRDASLFRYRLSDIFQNKTRQPELLAAGVSVFLWRDAEQTAFLAFRNLSLQIGPLIRDFEQITWWKSAVSVGEQILLVGYYYSNKTNLLLLLDNQLNDIWSSSYECRRKGTVADQQHIGAIKLLSEPILINGTAFVMAACTEDEIFIVSVKNGRFKTEKGSTLLGVAARSLKPEVISVSLGVRPQTWVVAGSQWLREVSFKV